MSLAVGPFRIISDKDAWQLNRFFKPDMDRVADATLPNLDTAGSASIAGADVTFKAAVQGNHQVALIWADDSEAVAELARFGVSLASDEVGIRIRLSGTASASAASKIPTGSLQIGLGVEGGATLLYERFNVYPLTTPITEAIADIVGGLRLPVQVDRVQALPAPKEILTVSTSGYLQLSADVTWGATLTNTRGARISDLSLELESKLALAATAAAKYRLGGEFEIHCCRCGERARFVVRKARNARFSFSADFALDLEFKTDGLPKDATEFMGKLLGGDTSRVLRALDRAEQLDSLDKVKEAVGEWASDAILELADPLIGNALDDSNTKKFLAELRKVTALYTSLDSRVAKMYEESIDDVPGLSRALDILATVKGPDALKLVSDERAWQIFRGLAGDRLYDALLDNDEYARVLSVVESARDFIANGPSKLKKTIHTLQQRLSFDKAIRQLNKLSSPKELKALADTQLQKAVSLLLDKSFPSVQKEIEPAFKKLQRALKTLDDFSRRWYDKLLETANSKFTSTVNAEFSRASSTEALLDVEIDVSTAEGQRLARRAALGDFGDVLESARLRTVKLRSAVLTHAVTRQTQLKVNVLGFEAKNVSRLITSSQTQFQQTSNGLLLLHTVEVKNEQERRRRDEQTLARFIFRGAAESRIADGDATRKHLVDTLNSLSVGYDFAIEDSRTSTEELLEYLGFAQLMGLIESPHAFVSQLQLDLPKGWTSVKVKYAIRYDPTAVAAVFLRDTTTLQKEAQGALAALIGRVLIVPGRPNDARLGLAFLDPATRVAYENARPDVPAGGVGVMVPAWVTRDKARVEGLPDAQKQLLRGVFNTEALYLQRLGRLDETMDKLARRPEAIRSPIETQVLDDVLTDFVALADDFPTDKKVNPFFGTFDFLILQAAPRSRNAALVLEITPADGGKRVTKYVSA